MFSAFLVFVSLVMASVGALIWGGGKDPWITAKVTVYLAVVCAAHIWIIPITLACFERKEMTT